MTPERLRLHEKVLLKMADPRQLTAQRPPRYPRALPLMGSPKVRGLALAEVDPSRLVSVRDRWPLDSSQKPFRG